jgi:hypothetical protein
MKLHTRPWIAGLAVVALVAVVRAQAPQGKPAPTPVRDATVARGSGTAAIAGTLIGVDSGRPIRRARVTLTSTTTTSPSVAKTVVTDDLGGFSFDSLPAGSYTLTASKAGYLDTIYGQTRPGTARPGTPVAVTDGQKIDRLSLPMARGAAISGTIVDEAGDPVFGAQVRVFRYVMRSGQRVLQAGDTAKTDDRGVYRIGVLPPGEYLVAAMPQTMGSDAVVGEKMRVEAAAIAARAQVGLDESALASMKEALERLGTPEAPEGDGYAPVYYPGTTQISSAAPLMVAPGQERAGVDVQLQLVPTATVSGSLTTGGGAPETGLATQVFLVNADQIDQGLPPRSGRVGADGRFAIGGVPPGHYTVIARSVRAVTFESPVAAAEMAARKAALLNQATFWAMSDVSVDGRPATVSLVLQKGMSVSGTIKLDGSGTAFDLSRLRLTLTPAVRLNGVTDQFLTLATEGSGAFTFTGVPPGQYRLDVAGAPAGWRGKTAIFGGRDAFDGTLDVKPAEDQSGVVTLTTRLATLSGGLQDSAGQPTSSYTIVVFPAEQKFWTPQSRRIRATRPATDGRYTVTDLPSGDYRLVAVTDVEPGEWFDPAYLRELAAVALPITLGDGERRAQDLRVK